MLSLPGYVLFLNIDLSKEEFKSCFVSPLNQVDTASENPSSDLASCLSKLGLDGNLSFKTITDSDGDERKRAFLEITSIQSNPPRIIAFANCDVVVKNPIENLLVFKDLCSSYPILIVLPEHSSNSVSSDTYSAVGHKFDGLVIPSSEIGIFYLPGDAVVYNGKTFKVLGGFPVVKNTSGDVIYVYALSDLKDEKVRVLVPESFLKLPS